MGNYDKEINRRRTFAIISHPDAGKTTLTEKFLLYGGAINLAGSVKGKATARHAVSDWMEIEKERGISVTSSVLQFNYGGYCINILDTPGHQDFSEDTYRTLMAADSAVMVIDAAKGIEPQTRKLFKVCAMRSIPIFTFINKMDHEARDPFDLLDELENEFGIRTYPMNWPISCGVDFRGIYDRMEKNVLTYSDSHAGRSRLESIAIKLDDKEKLLEYVEENLIETLKEETDLLDAAGEEFDLELVKKGKLSPVFFGSALNNFGVEQFLETFLTLSCSPLPRKNSDGQLIDPLSDNFSAFVFKIQANMNKAHRDRISFLRICSGKYERGKEYFHIQSNKSMRLSQPQQMMAQEREIIDEAYAGDIIGIFDPGVFSIGDTICDSSAKVNFTGIPTFAPEHFAIIEQIDSMKRKQFAKGMYQIAQEGAIQIYFFPGGGMERVIVGVVGVLQFDVLKFRMKSEYGVEYLRQDIPHDLIRYVDNADFDATKLSLDSDTKWVKDIKDNNLLIFNGNWSINWALKKNPDLLLREFGSKDFEE